MGPITFYPKGGTAMLTVRQVAQVIVGAAEKSKGKKTYPISYYNYTWNDFLAIVHEAMGKPNRKIINITNWMFKLFGLTMRKQYKDKGIESGIDPVGLADIMCMNTFIDNKWAKYLGATDDNIKAAIFDSSTAVFRSEYSGILLLCTEQTRIALSKAIGNSVIYKIANQGSDLDVRNPESPK